MKQSLLLTFSLLIGTNVTFAQQQASYKTWNPAKDQTSVVAGQGWHSGLQSYYDRLPAKAASSVRKEVWNLSKNSAGLNLRFKSDAPEITIKYAVSGYMRMDHMPATGVSGVDLYAQDAKGKWLWAGGKYTFGDTVVYKYTNLNTTDKVARDYTLYLPLYNTVKWMEISVPEQSVFTPLPVSTEKPIVVYGTSIAQGGCASRAGLAWTSILSRRLNRPLVNLAFSGNGRLEKEVFELLPEIDASLYILDCLPNLTGAGSEEIIKRVEATVAHLQSKKPGVPILLTEHDGYTDEGLNATRKQAYELANVALQTAFTKLKAKGVKNIYYLSKAAINQDIESMVDGTHPNDIGMMHYADAYEKVIRKIK
ncbi:MAG: SGNH/GDSL hydrolase family protein [Candidatus Pedobacter colombiensis]|uniref:SGNH/GDSL hydrolase family protein n=1 Tax=Candidatus Pedobacter colombiensis TaxID=3121371 RepID=A0AAJ6B7F6_9SPHI|nr:SGNH/GDSL hydrolase family protein [Pedobacter sp.]WEK18018.1 MAG: SGNH/GDSL hydrolase family protein [Pedobacter sp.]